MVRMVGRRLGLWDWESGASTPPRQSAPSLGRMSSWVVEGCGKGGTVSPGVAAGSLDWVVGRSRCQVQLQLGLLFMSQTTQGSG